MNGSTEFTGKVAYTGFVFHAARWKPSEGFHSDASISVLAARSFLASPLRPRLANDCRHICRGILRERGQR